MKKLLLVLTMVLCGCNSFPNLDNSRSVNCDGQFIVYDFPYTGKPKYVYVKFDKMRETSYKTTYRYSHNNMNLKIVGGWVNKDSIVELKCYE